MNNIVSFNQDWRFTRDDCQEAFERFFDDSEFEVVCLPHSVRIEQADCSGGHNYLGVAWYRKRFYADETFIGKKLFLTINGAKHLSEIYLNGELIKINYGGYIPNVMDIENKILYDKENLLAIKLDNRDFCDILPGKPQGGLDFCYFGGLYRSVDLTIKDKIYITNSLLEDKVSSGGVFIHTDSANSNEACLSVKTHIRNELETAEKITVKTSFYDNKTLISDYNTTIFINPDSDSVINQKIIINSPILWSPSNPKLYTIKVSVLSNKTYDEEIINYGIRTIEWRHEGFFINGELLKINGANKHQEYVYIGDAVSKSLIRRDAKLLKSGGFNCFRTGHYPHSKEFMDICDELGIMCIVPTPGWQHFRDNEVFKNRCYQNIREMIRWHRNHPSVILWEPVLNETYFTNEFANAIYNITHEEYPFKDCYAAADLDLSSGVDFDVFYKNSDSINKPNFTREYGDFWIEQYGPTTTQYRCHRGERGFYPGGEKAMIRSTDERIRDINKILTSKNQAGGCLWVGIDTNRGYMSNIAACGVLDLYRIPKLTYYYYSAMNNYDLVIDGKEFGGFIKIASFWNVKSSLRVPVFSNCEIVELYLNSEKIGTQKVNNRVCYFDFDNFTKGTLLAKGYINGKEYSTDTVVTAEKAIKLNLWCDFLGEPLIADGSDMIMIYASAVDQNGVINTQNYDKVYCEVIGEGTLVETNGNRQKLNPIELEAGIIGFLIKTSKNAGEISIKVSSDNLEDGYLTINSSESTLNYVNAPCEITEKSNYNYTSDNTMIFSPPTAMAWEDCPNIANQCNVTCSSYKTGYTCSNITKSNNALKWVAKTSDNPQWVKIDLEKYYSIKGIKIVWESDNTFYTYQIEVSSDDISYSQKCCKIASGQSQNIDECIADDIRYIKIVITKVTKGTPGICLVEVLKQK